MAEAGPRFSNQSRPGVQASDYRTVYRHDSTGGRTRIGYVRRLPDFRSSDTPWLARRFRLPLAPIAEVEFTPDPASVQAESVLCVSSAAAIQWVEQTPWAPMPEDLPALNLQIFGAMVGRVLWQASTTMGVLSLVGVVRPRSASLFVGHTLEELFDPQPPYSRTGISSVELLQLTDRGHELIGRVARTYGLRWSATSEFSSASYHRTPALAARALLRSMSLHVSGLSAHAKASLARHVRVHTPDMYTHTKHFFSERNMLMQACMPGLFPELLLEDQILDTDMCSTIAFPDPSTSTPASASASAFLDLPF